MAQVCEIVKVCPYADYAVMYWEDNGHFPYVACWLPKIKEDGIERKPTLGDAGKTVECYWGQGHYFQHIEDALEYALDRETEAFKERR